MYDKDDKQYIATAYLACSFFSLGGYILSILFLAGRLFSKNPQAIRHFKQITVIWVIWLIGAGIFVAVGGKDVFTTTIGTLYFLLPVIVFLIGGIQVLRDKEFGILFKE